MFLALYSSSQVKISEINFNRVEYKTIRDYLHLQQEHNIQSLYDIKPSMPLGSDNSDYRIDERLYVIKDSLAKVWKHYIVTNPCDSWNGNRVSFGLMLSKKEDQVVYRGDNVAHLDTGQVVYLNLKLFKGLTNLATVFEFISIDKVNNIIEFSYIDGNITEGKQQLKFSETIKGYTKIIHTTYFKGKSALRDRLLYPYFHGRLINDFHRNMKKLYYAQQTHGLDNKLVRISFDNEESLKVSTEPE